MQFGASFVAAQKNELSAAGVSNNGLLNFSTDSPVTTGNAFADLLVGSVDTFSQQNAQLKYYNRYKIFEPYFQDDWRATNHLTLNLGLRMSLFGTYRERYHNAYNFDPRSLRPAAPAASILIPDLVIGDPFNGMVQCGVTAGVPEACMKGTCSIPRRASVLPGIPSGNGKTAIRGGYGVFFEHTNGNEANSESLESSPPGSLIPSIHNIIGYQNIVPQDTGSTSPLAVVSIPTKAVWPYVQQWHLDVQRDISHNMVATVSYVGSKGTHLTRQYDLNQVAPTPAQRQSLPGWRGHWARRLRQHDDPERRRHYRAGGDQFEYRLRSQSGTVPSLRWHRSHHPPRRDRVVHLPCPADLATPQRMADCN